MIDQKLIQRMTQFASNLTVEDIAGCSRMNTADSSRGAGGTKQPSFSPPPEYSGVELLADLKQALDTENYPVAVSMYFNLKRLLNH